MNQDQAHRMAEELMSAEELIALWPGNPGEGLRALATHYARKAIAAALVKYTQGQEPVGYTSPNELTRIAACKGQFAALHRERIGSNDVAVYTHPIPSQQEERKPLTDEQAAEILGFERGVHFDENTPCVATFSPHNMSRIQLVQLGWNSAHKIKEQK